MGFKLINHNAMLKLKAETDHLFPLSAVDNGYVATANKQRVIFQLMLGDDPIAQQYGIFMEAMSSNREPVGKGTAGITPKEAKAILTRLVALPHVETQALRMQRWLAKSKDIMLEVQKSQRSKTPPTAATMVMIGTLLSDLAKAENGTYDDS